MRLKKNRRTKHYEQVGIIQMVQNFNFLLLFPYRVVLISGYGQSFVAPFSPS